MIGIIYIPKIYHFLRSKHCITNKHRGEIDRERGRQKETERMSEREIENEREGERELQRQRNREQ